MLKAIGIVAALVAAAFLGYVLSQGTYFAGESKTSKEETKTGAQWVAAAPGRVEPGSGEVNIGAAILGQVADVTVKLNDQVEEGELLIRLDDEEARARLAAAEAEAGLRKRQRDAEPATSGREDVTKGEDNVYSAEREVIGARFELDAALTGKRRGDTTESQLADARRRLAKAQERVERERLNYAVAQAKANLPSPNQFESALTAARANVALAASQLDKTRIRTPRKGRVLQLAVKQGEIVSPSPEHPLVVVGDMDVLKVKAEVDDGDVAKIRVGQRAFVRSINYPGRDFEGKVTALAPTMATPRISARGPRRPSDIEVLEMTIDLEGNVPLLPGMRVDAFVRPER